MIIKAPCENCKKTVEVDTATLPKMNSIALKAAKAHHEKTREVYVDCPHCHEETVVNVPIED